MIEVPTALSLSWTLFFSYSLADPRLGDNPQIAKSGELPSKALVRVDAIRKACLANLDCAQDCFFPEVEHPVDERPVCNLVVGRGMKAIAGNHCIPQRSLFAHLGNSRHRKGLGDWQIVESGEFIPQLPPAIDISVRYVEDFIARFVLTQSPQSRAAEQFCVSCLLEGVPSLLGARKA